jgi:VCBS repeat-containing protein
MATDPDSLFDEDSATFTVNAVNDSPVAQDDAYSASEDTQLNIVAPGVLANDSDIEADSLTAMLDTTASNGMLTLKSDGSFTYTPNSNFNNTDTFTYHASDGTANSNVATVTITVGPENDPPVANDDSNTTPEDTLVTTNVVANDTDVDGTVVASTVAIGSGASNGSVVNNGDGTVTYRPDANFNGSDTYTYTLRDNYGAPSNAATVTITVGPVNDPPIAYDDTVLTDENTSLSIKVTLNDDDPDGTIDPTTITIAGAPVNGTVQVAGDGTITYSPNAFFSGIDQFTYTVEDNEGATSNVAMVMVTVVGVNDPPIAGDDFVTTKSGVPVSIAILSNDSDPDGSLIPETVTMLSEPESGTATVNLDGTITYTSVEGFVGTDQFTYRVEDAHNTISNEATVTVEVLEMCGEGGDNKCAAQEAMSSVGFLKHDTNNISWLVLVDPEEKERSYYILIVDSTVLEEFALSANIQPTETHAGAPLEVGLELSAEERRTRGWPWIRVTGPDLAESANGGAAGIGVGYSFSGRSANGLYWLGINTSNLPPGRYNFWIVYGERETLLVPILVLP